MVGTFVFIITSLFSGYMSRINSYIEEKHGVYPVFSKYTWTNVGPEGGFFIKVAADPQDSNLAVLQGIVTWITRDGTTWQPLRGGGMDSYITFTGFHRLLLGTVDTLYYSSDGAFTFSPIRTGFIYSMSLISSDTVYLVQDSMGLPYLYRTTDGGLNWTRITPLSYVNYYYITYAPSNPDIIYMAVQIDYSSDSVFIVRSLNGGLNWTILGSIGDGVDVTDIEVNPYNPGEAFIACGFDGDFGLIYTQDSFNTINSLPQIIIPFDVRFLSSDSILIASVIPTGIMLGVRDTSGWKFNPVDTLTTCTGIARSGNVFYVSATTGALKSTDGAQTFSLNESGLHGTFTYSGKVLSNMINRTVYMPSIQGNALYITRNGGVSWEKVYIPNVAVIFDVEANPGDENIVYVACGAGKIDTTGNLLLYNVLRSTDGGMTFVPMDSITGNPDSLAWIESLHTFSDSPDVVLGMLMVYTDYTDTMKIIRSTDGGATFNDTTGIFTFYYDDFAGDNPVLIQADSALFVSHDYGLSFDTLKLIPEMVQSMTFYEKDSLLFYNTYYYPDSVYALRISDMSENVYYIPGVYHLYSSACGGLYGLASMQNYMFYAGTFDSPFDTSEVLDFPAGAIRASSNEVLLFSYGIGVYRSTDAVAYIRQDITNKNLKYRDVILYGTDILRNLPASLTDRMDVYTPQGRLVKSYSKGEKRIDLKNLPQGIYVIKINGKHHSVFKVVKIK